MQTSYPFFETGQVLSATHLNDLADYLEEQDRLTRNKLIGIGIACGLQVALEPANNQVSIGGGVAISSQGYLLVHPETLYSHFRTYTLPKPHVEAAPEVLLNNQPYPFFHQANGNQRTLWELLPVGFVATPGETAPTLLTAAFLQDKVALLFLERNLEALKNCDINDCSDKGAEWEFTLRALLVSKGDAQLMLQQEATIAQRPVDPHNHPRYDLKELQVEKLNLAAHDVDSFFKLWLRIGAIATSLAGPLNEALLKSYDVFQYLLADIYPPNLFPLGPFGSPTYFSRVFGQVFQNPFLIQTFYAYMVDVVRSYNEFLRAASQLDAECCPHPDRFPLHVLLGVVVVQPTAFAGDPGQLGNDPLKANSGFGLTTRPLAFRHHFIPSPLYDRQAERLVEVRSLHYRTFLLAYRYTLDGLVEKEIRLTPSKEGDVQLSDQAIPFYYALQTDPADDDLARNWAYAKTVRNRLDRLFSYQYINSADHPLRYRMDDHNFYRVEGAVGKTLGDVMRTLIDQKRQLGLVFAIEPVYIGLFVPNDLGSMALDATAQQQARQALLKMLICRMGDLDIFFLILMTPVFQYLLRIIGSLSRINTGQLAGVTRLGGGEVNVPITRFSPKQAQNDRRLAEALLQELRPQVYKKGTLTAKLTTASDPKLAIGRLYQEIKEGPSTANLFDRTLEFAPKLAGNEKPEVIAQRLYPTVSLLDKAEELVATVRAPTLAEFNFQEFEERYDGFVQAFENYLAQSPTENPVIQQAQEAVIADYNSIAASAPQAVLTGLAGELKTRIANIFGDLFLGAYAQRRPGLEHKGGVPVGGTLILLYTHRNFLTESVTKQRQTYEKTFTDVRQNYGKDTGETLRDPRQALAAPTSTTDPLNDFVVLGDLCLPYLCCDSDCSDISLTGDSGAERTPTLVRGTIFAVQTADSPQAAPLRSARIKVINLATNEALPVEISNGVFTFRAPPGSYRIDASARNGFVLSERVITVGGGGERVEDFVLQPRGR